MKLNFETKYNIGDRVLVNYVAQGDGQTHHHDSNMMSLFHKGDILQSEKGTIESIIVFMGSDGRFRVRYGIELDNYMYDNEYEKWKEFVNPKLKINCKFYLDENDGPENIDDILKAIKNEIKEGATD